MSFSQSKAACYALVLLGTLMLFGYRCKSVLAQEQSAAGEERLTSFASTEMHTHCPAEGSAKSFSQRQFYARRADASFVRKREIRSPEGELAFAVELVNFADRYIVTLEPFTQSRITSYYTEGELRHYRKSSIVRCQDLEASPTQLGANVLFIETVDSDSRSKNKMKKWTSRDIDCYPLVERIDYSDGAYALSQVQAISFEAGEIDKLFVVPAEYVERSPREVQLRYASRYPGQTLFSEEHLKKIEARYHAHAVRR